MNDARLVNFLKVLISSLTSTLKLVTLGVGILVAFLIPSLSLVIIPLSLACVGVMVIGDLSNGDYVKHILNPKQNKIGIEAKISNLLEKIQRQLEVSCFQSEVESDLISAKNSLIKIQNTIQTRSDQLSIKFLEDYLPNVVDKMLFLSNQELSARNYLQTEDTKQIQTEILNLQAIINKTTDAESKNGYLEALNLKQEQIIQIETVRNQLNRIDSQITRIKAVLEQSNTYLTRLNLQTDNSLYDETTLLTESLKQISSFN